MTARVIQRACDRCTRGVMDADNPHLHGLCECPCHSHVEVEVFVADDGENALRIVAPESGPQAHSEGGQA